MLHASVDADKERASRMVADDLRLLMNVAPVVAAGREWRRYRKGFLGFRRRHPLPRSGWPYELVTFLPGAMNSGGALWTKLLTCCHR
jgi:hypothetical protein